MKTLEDLKALREKLKNDIKVRQNSTTKIIIGMGTCGMVGPIGVYAGWVNDVATGAKAAITSLDWVGLALICFVLPSAYCALFSSLARIWVLTRAMSFLTSLKRLGLSS